MSRPAPFLLPQTHSDTKEHTSETNTRVCTTPAVLQQNKKILGWMMCAHGLAGMSCDPRRWQLLCAHRQDGPRTAHVLLAPAAALAIALGKHDGVCLAIFHIRTRTSGFKEADTAMNLL